MTDHQKIRDAIESALAKGWGNFVICPFGDYGMQTKQILNVCFGIQEQYIIDNRLSKYNPEIKNIEYFQGKVMDKHTILLACADPYVHDEILEELNRTYVFWNIVDIFQKEKAVPVAVPEEKRFVTRCGKYSYGPLCSHQFVESVGAFSSFAFGTDVVQNHPVQYISTHPFLYFNKGCNETLLYDYEECSSDPWYFPGVKPYGSIKKLKRIKIGNDVWLGRNVIITNGSNIGNGVIAAVGAVITKDVPDYAVVAGVPARIIRYRFSPEQIAELNRIAWWDWPDEKIREHYDDFYEDIHIFVRKHKCV